MNGNLKTSPDNVAFGQLDDPTPNADGNFAGSSAGIGDVAGDARNEILVGALGPFLPGANSTVTNDVHVSSSLTQQVLLTLDDPDKQGGPVRQRRRRYG